MLPARHRVSRSSDFVEVTRQGRRAGTATLVVHHLPVADGVVGQRDPVVQPRVGFVVSRSVGGSVVRHRVTRRLRHLAASRLGGLPSGTRTVVRALPAAATADSDRLGRDLDAALARVVPRARS